MGSNGCCATAWRHYRSDATAKLLRRTLPEMPGSEQENIRWRVSARFNRNLVGDSWLFSHTQLAVWWRVTVSKNQLVPATVYMRWGSPSLPHHLHLPHLVRESGTHLILGEKWELSERSCSEPEFETRTFSANGERSNCSVAAPLHDYWVKSVWIQ